MGSAIRRRFSNHKLLDSNWLGRRPIRHWDNLLWWVDASNNWLIKMLNTDFDLATSALWSWLGCISISNRQSYKCLWKFVDVGCGQRSSNTNGSGHACASGRRLLKENCDHIRIQLARWGRERRITHPRLQDIIRLSIWQLRWFGVWSNRKILLCNKFDARFNLQVQGSS